MFPRGLCPDRDWCCVNSARAVARALFHSISPYQGIVPEGTCTISFIIPNNRRQNHNIPDCPTFWCYNNTNIKLDGETSISFFIKQNQLKSTKPGVGDKTQLITHVYYKTTRHLNDIHGQARGTRDQFMTRHSLGKSDHFLSDR